MITLLQLYFPLLAIFRWHAAEAVHTKFKKFTQSQPFDRHISLHMIGKVYSSSISKYYFENNRVYSSKVIEYDSVNGIEIDNRNNITASLLRLVSFGDNYFISNDLRIENLNFTPLTKVRGCIAEVKVKVALSDSKKIFVSGNADSRIAQGMLALVCKVMI